MQDCKTSVHDIFYTPEALAMRAIELSNLKEGDVVLDAFAGKMVFYDNYPSFVKKEWCEITAGMDFFKYDKMVDYVVTNPPYSILDDIFKKLVVMCNKGFTLILSMHNLTPKRIDELAKSGFEIRLMHLVRVKRWFGYHVVIVWEKNYKNNTISCDRKIYDN